MRQLLLSLCLSLSVSLPCWAGASTTFDGTDDYYDCGAIFNVGGTSESYSIGFWINRYNVDVTNKYVVTHGNYGSGKYPFRQEFAAGATFNVPIYDGTNNPSPLDPTTLPANTWVFLLFTRNVTDDKVYIYNNCTQVAGVSDTTTVSMVNGRKLWIGEVDENSDNGTYQGDIAYVGLWNGILTSQECSEALYHPGMVTNNLHAFWTLTTTNGEDISGNGRACTATLGPTASGNGPPIFMTSPTP